MAKIIKLTPEIIEEARRGFEDVLTKAKLADGKISYTKTFGSFSRKATVYFTEIAWLKMQALVREFDKEVAWHGLAYRGDDPTKDEYTITDILVYPQEVTGATVTSDQNKYQSWLMDHDDEVFNNIRMQGHSHVNMSVSPSSVDTALYEKILDQLDDTMFYIFLIYNKRGDKTYMIYDMAKNVMFETSDVTVKIIDDGSGLTSFLEDAKSKVQTKVFQFSAQVPATAAAQKPAALPAAAPPQSTGAPVKTAADTKPAAAASTGSDTKKNGSFPAMYGKKSGAKRKGKRRNKPGLGASGAKSGNQQKKYSFTGSEYYEGFDDDDDSYSSLYGHLGSGYGYGGGYSRGRNYWD